jgi:hypothetical protein
LHGSPVNPNALIQNNRTDLFPSERPGLRISAYPGSAGNILYGIDSESYLTPEQRKLARMIQGKFDASADSRDIALQRYGAPRLSSFAEDESLARAMSLARGLNTMPELVGPGRGTPTPVTRFTTPVDNSSINKRYPTPPPVVKPPGTSTTPEKKDPPTDWMKLLQGLAAIYPLIFGKEALLDIMKTGAWPVLRDWMVQKYKEITGQVISSSDMETMLKTNYAGGPAGYDLGGSSSTDVPGSSITTEGIGPPGDLTPDEFRELGIDPDAFARMGFNPDMNLNYPTDMGLGESVSGNFDLGGYDLMGGDGFIPPDLFDGFTGGYDAFIP